ncbi:hypothetical protein JHK87_024477 [Glycine soja]|nr:hypothetical protein JHK87_024477 [Glycine soja]
MAHHSGANFAWLVRILMIVCYPVSYPVGKVLDHLVGHNEALFRRAELKALVSIHGQEMGFQFPGKAVYSVITLSLRRFLGYSDGEVMRSDAKPCFRLMRHIAAIFSVGGAFGFWVLCRMHYGLFYLLPSLLSCSI